MFGLWRLRRIAFLGINKLVWNGNCALAGMFSDVSEVRLKAQVRFSFRKKKCKKSGVKTKQEGSRPSEQRVKCRSLYIYLCLKTTVYNKHFVMETSGQSSPAKSASFFFIVGRQNWCLMWTIQCDRASPCWSFGSRYCQKKHPVITSDSTRKNTRPSCVHFTFILPLLASPSNLTVAAGGAAAAGVCFMVQQKTHEVGTECVHWLHSSSHAQGSDHFSFAMLSSAVNGGRNPCQLVSLLE